MSEGWRGTIVVDKARTARDHGRLVVSNRMVDIATLVVRIDCQQTRGERPIFPKARPPAITFCSVRVKQSMCLSGKRRAHGYLCTCGYRSVLVIRAITVLVLNHYELSISYVGTRLNKLA